MRTIIVVTRKRGVCYSFACRACAVRIHALPDAHMRESPAYRSCHEEALKLQTTKMRLELGTHISVITMKQNGLSYQEILRHVEEEDIPSEPMETSLIPPYWVSS